ncbi:MAG: hypothetical protein Q9218_006575 [Villophora microphyllina]
MSNYDDSNTSRSGYGGDSGSYGGSRGDDSYGSSGRRGGLGDDDSYGSSGRGGIGDGDDSYGSSGRGGDDSYGSSGREVLGSGISGGAGSGNKYTSGVQQATSLGKDYGSGNTSGESTGRNEPYSGHNEFGSGSVGGAGFGNKSSGGTTGDSSYGGNSETARNSDPYTGHNEYGSGATGGAGFGNKSTNRKNSDDGKPGDSTSGKLMEKMGGMFGNEKMADKGREKRGQAGYGDDSGSGDYGGRSVERSNGNIAALLRRFQNIIEYKPGDRNAAAVDTYRMEVETAALIRAAEDILSLTRNLKEMWLFGKLETVGTNEAEARAEESAKGVEEGLRKMMGSSYPPLTLVVATTPSLGIGLRGSLPWPPLKSDLQFFARVTKRLPSPATTKDDCKQPLRNAVIMGRKTFDSIPPKFRPLKDRINVVITRTPSKLESYTTQSNDGGVLAASSIPDGLQQLRSQDQNIGRVFVIGGAEIYRQAIGLEECERVLWTRLGREWDCDTWFPEGILRDGIEEGNMGQNGWRRRTRKELEDWTGEEGVGGMRSEGEVEFEISMWERKKEAG